MDEQVGSKSSGGVRQRGQFTSKEYVEAVRAWVWAYHNYTMAQCLAPMMAQNAMKTAIPTTVPPVCALPPHANQGGQGRVDNRASNGQAQRHVETRVYHVATYGRRLLAELIDGLFGFVIKLAFVFMLVEFDMIDLDQYDSVFGSTTDLKSIIVMMQDLMPLEMTCKLVVSFLEAVLMYTGIPALGIPPGCTPGKYIMGIRVISCDDVAGLGANDSRVNVRGPKALHWRTSFLRAFTKNFAIGFLFPLCVTMYLGRNNRAMYDFVSGTIVVEVE